MSALSEAGPTPQPAGARKTALVRPIRIRYDTTRTVSTNQKFKTTQEEDAMSQASATSRGSEQTEDEECNSSVSCECSRGGPDRFAQAHQGNQVA